MKIIPYSVLAATLLGGAISPAASGGAGFIAAADVAAASRAQEDTKSKAAAPDEQLVAIPTGTMIYAELSKPIDVKKVKPGDEIVARSTLPVLSQGKIAIPNDTKIVGHVTEAVTRSGDYGHSKLGILFDHVWLKNGTTAPIALTIQAVGRHPLTAHSADPSKPANSEVYPLQTHPYNSHPTYSTPSNPISRTPSESELPSTEPTLDVGSHGIVGMPDLKLIESEDAWHGSVIVSTKKNVKLDSETELVLRVIAEPTDETSNP